MEYSSHCKKQLTDKIVDKGNILEYEILHYDKIESDLHRVNKYNGLSSYSYSMRMSAMQRNTRN